MTLRVLILGTVGAAVLAYTPSAQEIITSMASANRNVDAVQVRVVREESGGEVLEEAVFKVPGRPGTEGSQTNVLDLPYSVLTLPVEEFLEILPSLGEENTKVSLGRLYGSVCYVLAGSDERIWISKEELAPLKIEILNDQRLGTEYLYLDKVNLSEKVRYPSRTEVWRNGELVLIERLIPAVSSSPRP